VFLSGVKHPRTDVLSGIVLVNAELADEELWSKIEISNPPGFALAQLNVTANVHKFSKFPEVEVLAICIHGVQRGGGAVVKRFVLFYLFCFASWFSNQLEEACSSELLAITPAWKKYHQVSCTVVQEVGIALQMVISKHISFVGSSFSRAAFVEFFLSSLTEGKSQDLIFVLKKPISRPIATFAKP
jgi:hypothetical protein